MTESARFTADDALEQSSQNPRNMVVLAALDTLHADNGQPDLALFPGCSSRDRERVVAQGTAKWNSAGGDTGFGDTERPHLVLRRNAMQTRRQKGVT